MTFSIGVTASREGLTSSQLKLIAMFMAGYRTSYGRDKIEFHQGCCVGGDEQLTIMALPLSFYIIAHPPIKIIHYSELARDLSDEVLEEKDYLDRNEDIVDASDVILAGPKRLEKEDPRSGTWHTIRYAKAKNKVVIVVGPDGNIITNETHGIPTDYAESAE